MTKVLNFAAVIMTPSLLLLMLKCHFVLDLLGITVANTHAGKYFFLLKQHYATVCQHMLSVQVRFTVSNGIRGITYYARYKFTTYLFTLGLALALRPNSGEWRWP